MFKGPSFLFEIERSSRERERERERESSRYRESPLYMRYFARSKFFGSLVHKKHFGLT